MTRHSLTVGLAIVLLGSAQAQAPQVLAFVGATLVDGTGAAPVEDGVLLVSAGRITAAGPRSRVGIPAGARQMDLRGRTILPGFINAHGHVPGDQGGTPTDQLRTYAQYGVTTVFSLGGNGGDSLRRERPFGRARLFIAGPVVDGTTADAAAGQVERNVAAGVDWIKIRVDDNLGATAKMPGAAWRAAIDRAHAHKIPVAAHLFYLDDAKDLLREGVDLLAHSIRDRPVDDEVVRLARERDVCLVPTLMREVSTFIYESTPDFFSDPFFTRHADLKAMALLTTPERQQQTRNSPAAKAYRLALDVASRNLKRMVDGGVRVAMGTDSGPAGRFQGYFEHLELELMVKAGLTPMQAIVAATGDAARCMRQAGAIGTLQPGAFADLAVYTSNPVADIRNTRTLESVWVAGEMIRQ